MIVLDEELARMEAMLARRERMALGVTCTEMIELITRLRQAEKDAARYRFMRDMSDEVDVSRFFYVELSERDAEIDEAMQRNGDDK